MGRVHEEIGTTMLEWLNNLPAEKESKSKTICNNTVLFAEAKNIDRGIEENSVSCYLHGHRIATLYKEGSNLMLELSCCGWETHTTKNRLSGVCSGISPRYQIATHKKFGLHFTFGEDETIYPFNADQIIIVNLKTGEVGIR